MFGGRVRPGIDSRWCSHVSLPKTAIQLLGLPPLGVPRVDDDGGLADLVDLSGTGAVMPKPPAFGSQITLPPAPRPTPPAAPLPPSPVTVPKLTDEVILRDGSSLGRPNDVLITHR